MRPPPDAGDPAAERRARLQEYGNAVEAFTRRLLDPYLARVITRTPPGLKEFNDAVWRTIVLYPVEVVVLDSPLLQRLRWIRQLGVADYVFDAASHTRLQHSIGSLHTIDRLVATINETAGETMIHERDRRLLRLTALCHDVGHGVMSHVSDNAMRLDDRVEQVRLAFGEGHELDRPPSLSEIAAYYMIGSPAFGELVAQAQSLTGDHHLLADDHLRMRNAIVGEAISDEIPQLQELVSGPFDADKLDYMTRDAQMAGVPEITDVPRLVRKVRCVPKARADMPPEVSAEVSGDQPFYKLLAIAHSGARTLDELMLGRILLFDKVYRHHKVRAVEAMVASILTMLSSVASEPPALIPLRFSDEQLLDLSVEDVELIAGRPLTESEGLEAAFAAEVAFQIKQRDLWVRCYAYSTRMPLDPYVQDPLQRAGILVLQSDVQSLDRRRGLVDRIAREVARILEICDPSIFARYPKERLHRWIWLDPPESSQEMNVTSRAYLISEDGQVIRYRDDYSEQKAWTDAYLQAREVGYVFAPPDLAPYVHLAAEYAVRVVYGIRVPGLMLDYAKQRRQLVNKVRNQLASAGYYAEGPADLRPLPKRLGMADVERRLTETATGLAGYMGPADEGAPDGLVKPARVRDFVRQFESDTMVDAALRAVETIRMIGRSELVGALREFLTTRPEFHRGILCTLGSAKDSAVLSTYFAMDLAREFQLGEHVLSEAVLSGRPLLFVDDFINTGDQAIDIVEAWLGAPRSRNLGEDRAALPPEIATAIRERKVAFVFAAGDKSGADKLGKRARHLGLDAQVSVSVDVSTVPTAFGSVKYKNRNQQDEFEAHCRAVGLRILASTHPGRDHAWREARALGYGNAAYLLTFPHNTPTAALTCLWGTDSRWFPLLPRRTKD